MPALSVSVDGNTLMTVSTDDGYDLLSINIHGSRIDEAFATLNLSGGHYPDDGNSTYLTWIDQMPLQPGQAIAVSWQDQGSTSARGKTIDELATHESIAPIDPKQQPPLSEIIAALKKRPLLRGQYAFEWIAPDSTVMAGQTLPEETSLTLSVIWHVLHRDGAARVSLHSTTLDNLAAHAPLHYRAQCKLRVGESIRLQLGCLALP
ncbi:hypothetical protein RSP822_08370 [Ralstonia solanacearum]|uniref:hypothetical protein n=1 Tax=Ralstonia solanacearum TaxID=305 RepID=UPI000E6662A1|nr:hypothetical protein [Ralstonia solanacearum]RIJ86816.1 hypothetical protein RSP822_08370 [Ralstonia solanacearum]